MKSREHKYLRRKSMFKNDFIPYSKVQNKRLGSNKRADANKQAGWKYSCSIVKPIYWQGGFFLFMYYTYENKE